MNCDFGEIDTFQREIERDDGLVIKINQLKVGDVGCVVWDAALVLSYFISSKYFETVSKKSLKDSKVLELGSGTGVVGLMAAVDGSQVVISDLPSFVPLMLKNISTNKHLITGSVEAISLDWRNEVLPNEAKDVDFVMLSDCLYYEEGCDPLIDTLTRVCSPQTQIYFCFEVRLSEQKIKLQKLFFENLRKKFSVEEIDKSLHHHLFSSDDIKIFKFNKIT